jgi:DNA-binding MarR family transcriptional regulator
VQAARLSSRLTELRSPHIGQLLRDAFFPLERALLARLAEAGFTGLRPTHNAVLRFLDEDGTRASELARRSGLTRQALTQIVDDLEQLGYVTRRDDPVDRRAKLVGYTERGRDAFRASRGIIADLERDVRRRLGPERYEHLRDALALLRADGPGAGGGAHAE